MRFGKKMLGLVIAVAGVAAFGYSAKANTIEPIITSVSAGGVYGIEFVLTPGNGLTNATNAGTRATPIGTNTLESALVIPDAGVSAFSFTAGVTAPSDWTISDTDTTGAATIGNLGNAAGVDTIAGGSPSDTETAVDSATATDLVLDYKGAGLAANGSLDPARVLLTGTITSSLTLAQLEGILTLSRDTDSGGNEVTEHYTITAAVPLPAASWMGMSTLLGLGALGAFRKRFQQA